MKLHPKEDDEDNFDIILDTAEKISILQPIMRPAILSPIMEELRSQCEQVLEQTLNTFFPSQVDSDEKLDSPTHKKSQPSEALPAWLSKWMPAEETEPAKENQKSNELEKPAEETQNGDSTTPAKPVKRRLKRCISDFDKTTKTHNPRNRERTTLI